MLRNEDRNVTKKKSHLISGAAGRWDGLGVSQTAGAKMAYTVHQINEFSIWSFVDVIYTCACLV